MSRNRNKPERSAKVSSMDWGAFSYDLLKTSPTSDFQTSGKPGQNEVAAGQIKTYVVWKRTRASDRIEQTASGA